MLGMKREDPARHVYMELIKKRIKDCEEKGDLEQAKKYKDILNRNNFIESAFITVGERRIKNAEKHRKEMENKYKKQRDLKNLTVSNVKIYDENGKELFYNSGPIEFRYNSVDRIYEEALREVEKKQSEDLDEFDDFLDPFKEDEE